MASTIVFNLNPFSDSLFLPSAHIVETGAGDQLGYPLQRATLATIGPHGHDLTPRLTRMLDLVESLQTKVLETRFKPPKAKTSVPLDKLLLEPDVKPVVERYLFEKLDAFFQEIQREKWPLTLGLERQKRGSDVLLDIPEDELIPHISFKKTESGVEYRFQLGNELEHWPIRSREIKPLTNTDPAWLLVNRSLFRVAGINGNMVKPFRDKDVVHIPLDKARTYFKQFVTKSAGRTRIEAEGFGMQVMSELQEVVLRPAENVLEKNWYLQPVFRYPGIDFYFGERRDRVTTVDFPQDGDGITVKQVLRDASREQEVVGRLLETGLELQGKLFVPVTGNSLENLIDWLSRNRQELENAGTIVEPLRVDDRTLALATGEVELETRAEGDWFDVLGSVRIGTFSFPFKAFLPHLRRRDRFFDLPDGTSFLIPDAWFARYTELAQSVRENGAGPLKLPKSLYTILSGAELDAGDDLREFQPVDPETIEYQPGPDLKATLRPYQLLGAKWLVGHYRAGFGACLADDMGLGKTLQTIALLLHAKEHKAEREKAGTAIGALASVTQLDLFQAYRAELKPLNALIILPASLVFNWQNELIRFAPSLISCAHTGPKRGTDARALAGYDVVLTTYHTARQDLDLLSRIHWHVIVLDESQQIKNRASEVSKVVHSLQADCKVSLSGTPIENSLGDLWSQMEFINPATLGSFAEFREQFLVPIEKRGDEGAKRRLFNRVRPFFLRRTKQEVAPDLPPLSEQVFYTEMTPAQHKWYDRIKSAARNEILSLFDDPKTRFQALQALTRLRQLANDPRLLDGEYDGGSGKFDDVMAQWDTVRRAGHKVLFFSSFEKHLQLFRQVFETGGYPFAWLTGDTAQDARAREVKRFQEDASVQAFFMTIKAGGVGLNLTAADYVFLLDPWWNPASEDQAIARAHRIGQSRPVTVIRFLARETIEEKIRLLQEKKKKLGQGLFETDDSPVLTREELEELLG